MQKNVKEMTHQELQEEFLVNKSRAYEISTQLNEMDSVLNERARANNKKKVPFISILGGCFLVISIVLVVILIVNLFFVP